MSNISKIDENLAAKTNVSNDTVFYDVTDAPFSVFGIIYPDGEQGKFLRMPQKIADSVSESVSSLNCHTAGGRIRFRTDSPFVTVKAEMENITRFPHMPMTGACGFDLYCSVNDSQTYVNTFVPPHNMENGYTSTIGMLESERDYTINMPLYNEVCRLYVGIHKDAVLLPCRTQYANRFPIVYYGSSITQGGCASRPGNCYQNIISRKLNCDYINLGFSGSAKAEQAIADYIKNLKMSAFVYDYDHNAPSKEYLERTHSRMFEEIRKLNPILPIIIVSSPMAQLDDCYKSRFDVIKNTYDKAIAHGDKNVYLINGSKMMAEFCGNDGTVDNVHPNDFGFRAMAVKIGGVLQQALNLPNSI